MRTILFAAAAVAATSVLNAGPTQAQQYPFCLISGPGPGDCKYTSYAQCMATASGTVRYCQPNYAMLPSGYGPVYPAPRGYRYYPQY